MVNATQIDGPAVGALLYAPEESLRDIPPALWLPARTDDERSLVDILRSSWQTHQWCGLRMALVPGTIPKEPASFADRYGNLQRERIAEGTLRTPSGLKVRADWCILDPAAEEIHAFLTDIQLTAGGGSCLALMAEDAVPGHWYAASTAITQRALLTMDSRGLNAGQAHMSATLAYLTMGPVAGFASLIPLNRHPWGGYVVIGDEKFLSELEASLPTPLTGIADISPQDVINRAGGLAF